MVKDRSARLCATAAFLVATLLTPAPAVCQQGMLPMYFYTCLDQASHIVHGYLEPSGDLTVKAVLKGGPVGKRITVESGDGAIQSLTSVRQQAGTHEVLVYLSKSGNGRWEIKFGKEGIVGFLGEEVYALEPSLRSLAPREWAKYPTFTRSSFLRTVRAAIAADEYRDRLLSEPASPNRIRKLVRFLQTSDPRARYLHQSHIAGVICPLTPPEEAVLVGLIERPEYVADSAQFLIDAGMIGRGSRRLFDAVAPLTKPGVAPQVRHAALGALATIDPYRAQETLIPLLNLDDPELTQILCAMGGDWFRQNPKVIEPLARLTEVLRERQRLGGPGVLTAEGCRLLYQLGRNGHPRLVGCVLEWYLTSDGLAAASALDTLQWCTNWTPDEQRWAPFGEPWVRWWLGAKDALFADYDLTTPAGRAAWYRAYDAGAAPTRELLLRLWSFEPAIDEQALLREASDKRHGETAKAVLAALWQHNRLSAAGKQAVVERFLALRLEEAPGLPQPPRRELRIVAERHFPFPPNRRIHFRYSISVGGSDLKLPDSNNECGLEGPSSVALGKFAGSFPGQREARALVEVSEAVSSGRKPAWTCRWELGPIRLRDAAGR